MVKKTTHKTLWIMTFKPFSPEKYLFVMTLAVSIEPLKKVNLFKPNTPQRQKRRFVSHSPYCPVVRLNGPRAYIRTPLYCTIHLRCWSIRAINSGQGNFAGITIRVRQERERHCPAPWHSLIVFLEPSPEKDIGTGGRQQKLITNFTSNLNFTF